MADRIKRRRRTCRLSAFCRAEDRRLNTALFKSMAAMLAVNDYNAGNCHDRALTSSPQDLEVIQPAPHVIARHAIRLPWDAVAPDGFKRQSQEVAAPSERERLRGFRSKPSNRAGAVFPRIAPVTTLLDAHRGRRFTRARQQVPRGRIDHQKAEHFAPGPKVCRLRRGGWADERG